MAMCFHIGNSVVPLPRHVPFDFQSSSTFLGRYNSYRNMIIIVHITKPGGKLYLLCVMYIYKYLHIVIACTTTTEGKLKKKKSTQWLHLSVVFYMPTVTMTLP